MIIKNEKSEIKNKMNIKYEKRWIEECNEYMWRKEMNRKIKWKEKWKEMNKKMKRDE